MIVTNCGYSTSNRTVLIQEITAVKVLSLHHDISTATGEEIVVFALAQAPTFRDTQTA